MTQKGNGVYCTRPCVVDVCAHTAEAVIRLRFNRSQVLLDRDQRIANLLHSLFQCVRIILYIYRSTGIGLKVGLRLRELAPAARGRQECWIHAT